MPKAKEFYADKLGLKVAKDNRRDDQHWWVSLSTSDGGTSIVLSTHHEHMKPGTMTLYFGTPDITATREELIGKKLEPSEVKDDLLGPGSGVKWFKMKDPDGSTVFLVQA